MTLPTEVEDHLVMVRPAFAPGMTHHTMATYDCSKGIPIHWIHAVMIASKESDYGVKLHYKHPILVATICVGNDRHS